MIPIRATVDPGINTAIAVWYGKRNIPTVQSFSVRAGIGEMKQLALLCKYFHSNMLVYQPKECFIESDEFWKGDLRSETSAEKGNLTLLSHIIGSYYGICFELGIDCHFIKAREWKGQMKKEIVARRVQMAIGQTYPSTHRMEAVGIGLALKGIL